MSAAGVTQLILDAYGDPAVKGRLTYFPDAVFAAYDLSDDERTLLAARQLAKLPLSGDLLDKAKVVFGYALP